MEPTIQPTPETITTTPTNNSSKIIIAVIVLLLIVGGAIFAMKNKTEAPVVETPAPVVSTTSETPAPSEKSMLEAEANAALNFDNESSLKEIDNEFN